MSRTRDTAAANETADIKIIVDAINSRSPAGLHILRAFKDHTGREITAARHRAGPNRGTHYDFEIEVEGVWWKVEHKGSQTYSRPGVDEVPWKAGVQFHNGGCEKYSLARKYARIWYTKYIKSGELAREFGVSAPHPSFEEWFERDCRVQSDPKSAYGKELKRNVRNVRGPKASLLDKRQAILDAFDFTEDDKRTLIAEVLPIANHALQQKEYWLSIHGPLEGNFHAVWYPQFTIEAIHDVTLKKNKDIEIQFACANNFTFNGILRWGKGAGFSCLRVDLK